MCTLAHTDRLCAGLYELRVELRVDRNNPKLIEFDLHMSLLHMCTHARGKRLYTQEILMKS